ncbi:MAG: hypothetical protein J07HQX50_01074 [Haloquadratum sp. J07HQX50]|nr:MAG: hypothetical protein J07HQX50_01074 [Haloquadratum sp. J07HQX50]
MNVVEWWKRRTPTQQYRLQQICLAVIAIGVSVVVNNAVFPHRSLNHDEAVYLQQAEMLLHGQLRLYPPVESAFRPWFFVDGPGGMYPKYAPLPAVVFATGMLIWDPVLGLAAVAAGVVLATTHLARVISNAQTGLLSGICVLGSPLFVIHSGVFLPYVVTSLLTVLFAVWYVQAEKLASIVYAIAAGGAIGAAFFARPYTAVIFAAPFLTHAISSVAYRLRQNTDTLSELLSSNLIYRRLGACFTGGLGVICTLVYNKFLTGKTLVFPYLAFAPQDGIGFGYREIAGHGVDYTPELALSANTHVLEILVTEWTIAGALGSLLAGYGLLTIWHRRQQWGMLLGGVFLTNIIGNTAFWGNYNIAGSLAQRSDGLISFLGPYYHFDVVLLIAIFAAIGAVRGWHRLRTRVDQPRVVLVCLMLIFAGGISVSIQQPIERNTAVSDELASAYAPVDSAAITSPAVVMLPPSYGPWLNHPFQQLRNEPGYNSTVVYALASQEPFSVVDEFSQYRFYRYVYAGSWNPTDAEPVRAAIEPVSVHRGDQLTTRIQIPADNAAQDVSVRVHGGEQTTYYQRGTLKSPNQFELIADSNTIRVGWDSESSKAQVGFGEELIIQIFVQTGQASGYSYRLQLSLDRVNGEVRALTPLVHRCTVPTRCVPSAVGESKQTPEVRVRAVSAEGNISHD